MWIRIHNPGLDCIFLFSVKYLQMADSLGLGETTYHLSDAKNLRMKLLKIAENVDLMSKKIAALVTDSGSVLDPHFQCCGSGSGRIRTFFSDPDPVKFSGSDHKKSYNKK